MAALATAAVVVVVVAAAAAVAAAGCGSSTCRAVSAESGCKCRVVRLVRL